MAFKRNKNLQEIIGDHTIKNEKVFKALKPIQKKTEKGNDNLATQVNQYYVGGRSLTPVHSEVTKHSKYTRYFTNYTIKANS